MRKQCLKSANFEIINNPNSMEGFLMATSIESNELAVECQYEKSSQRMIPRSMNKIGEIVKENRKELCKEQSVTRKTNKELNLNNRKKNKTLNESCNNEQYSFEEKNKRRKVIGSKQFDFFKPIHMKKINFNDKNEYRTRLTQNSKSPIFQERNLNPLEQNSINFLSPSIFSNRKIPKKDKIDRITKNIVKF